MDSNDVVAMLSSGLGIAISLAVSYIPKFNDWFYGIAKEFRGLVMVGFLAVVSGVVYGLSCAQLFNFIDCSKDGLMALLRGFFIIVATNQLTYIVTPPSPAKARLAGEAVVKASPEG